MKNLKFSNNFLKELSSNSFFKENKWKIFSFSARIAFVILLTCILSHIFSSLLVAFMPSPAKDYFQTLPNKADDENSFNYYNFNKTVKYRNLFNAEGKLAEDSLLNSDPSSSFDLSGPCTPSVLPLELRGTVVSGKDSFMTVIHNNNALIFKIGENLPDFENVSIVDIREHGVILNHNGKKECLYLIKGMTSLEDNEAKKTKITPPAVHHTQSTNEFTLESKWVESKLGASFAKIMQDIYTVPEIDPENGQILGYKLYRVQKNGLFGKMGLKDQDIITSINGQSMQESTVLALYEGLHNDGDVSFQYERNGIKHSVKVRVK